MEQTYLDECNVAQPAKFGRKEVQTHEELLDDVKKCQKKITHPYIDS